MRAGGPRSPSLPANPRRCQAGARSRAIPPSGFHTGMKPYRAVRGPANRRGEQQCGQQAAQYSSFLAAPSTGARALVPAEARPALSRRPRGALCPPRPGPGPSGGGRNRKVSAPAGGSPGAASAIALRGRHPAPHRASHARAGAPGATPARRRRRSRPPSGRRRGSAARRAPRPAAPPSPCAAPWPGVAALSSTTTSASAPGARRADPVLQRERPGVAEGDPVEGAQRVELLPAERQHLVALVERAQHRVAGAAADVGGDGAAHAVAPRARRRRRARCRGRGSRSGRTPRPSRSPPSPPARGRERWMQWPNRLRGPSRP